MAPIKDLNFVDFVMFVSGGPLSPNLFISGEFWESIPFDRISPPLAKYVLKRFGFKGKVVVVDGGQRILVPMTIEDWLDHDGDDIDPVAKVFIMSIEPLVNLLTFCLSTIVM